jgi:PEGA domain
MRNLKFAGLVLGALLIITLPASAAGHFSRGIVVGPRWGSWGWYNPYFYAPYGWYGYYGPYPVYRSNMGELKLKTNVKDADVYIDGAYAGKASKLKSMWLRPAKYNIEIRAPGYAPYIQQVYLLPGKTMHIKADLGAEPRS